MKAIALVLGLLVALLVGCGENRDGSAATGGGDTPVSDNDQSAVLTPPPDVGPDPGGRPQRTRPQPGMADLRQVTWEKARQTPSGRSIRVTYWSGVEPCNVLDHVDVDYRPSRIEVTLYEGHDPNAGDVACIEIALQKVVHVPLEQPVDGRRIVDGAKA